MIRYPVKLAWVLALGLLPAACQTRRAPEGGALSDVAEADPGAKGGYFVALSALPLFDGVHDAVDKLNRKRLAAQGELDAYIEAYDADGYTRLAAGDDEIECDREKCLLKLTGRVLVSQGDGDDSMAALMTEAFALKGVKPEVRGEGDAQLKTFVLGRRPGSFISCTQKSFGKAALYRCEFDLDKDAAAPANAAVENAGHGKLVSCALSPGTLRTADEAKKEVEGGGLLSLTSGSAAGAKPVGYLRYVKQGSAVEFLDLYLCGDVSHDFFHIEGAARRPKGWLGTAALSSLTQDEAEMKATTKVVEESSRIVTVEVRFKLAKEQAADGEVFGDDAFFVKLDKAWLQ